ncbi:MAG: hypothetical protein IT433_13490 [Phycisphaerales bacterium]|nr:hypothetical protein [Phycisphaerales bacterium]
MPRGGRKHLRRDDPTEPLVVSPVPELSSSAHIRAGLMHFQRRVELGQAAAEELEHALEMAGKIRAGKALGKKTTIREALRAGELTRSIVRDIDHAAAQLEAIQQAQEFGVAVKPMASEDQPVVAGGVTVNIMARVPEQAKKSK